jgi:hypothetical protein
VRNRGIHPPAEAGGFLLWGNKNPCGLDWHSRIEKAVWKTEKSAINKRWM